MKTITLGRIVTVTEELGGRIVKITEHKYKELPQIVDGETEIKVNYVFGEAKRRENQLKKLGFKIKETIFFNDERPHSPIKRIFVKE